MTTAAPRHGITAAGNWIVDRIKTVDRLPARGMLANIRGEARSTGGAPANVLADLARLGSPFPLAGCGAVGRDADGDFILASARTLGIDMDRLVRIADAPTSYTDVMNEEGSGDRSFFHNRGANACFGPEHVPVATLDCRLFHFGYLLLLDRMDAPDAEYGIVAARLLQAVRARGIRTSVDVVSEDSDRFRSIVPPALRHTDYLIINEIEAGRIVGRQIRRPDGALAAGELVTAVETLMGLGAMDLVAVHMPEGAYLRHRDGSRHCVGALDLPPGFIRSALGAGDAFCAGLLYGLHEGWPPVDALRFGGGVAAAALSREGATEGVGTRADIEALMRRLPERKPPL